MFFLGAISLGFLGSFHCIGMCGPIALSIPVKRTSLFSVFSGSLIYNAGRVLTYASMGLLLGTLGYSIALAGWQNILSVSLGIIILASLIIPKIPGLSFSSGFLYRMLEKIKSKIRKQFGIHTLSSLFFIGMLNGLLPCGLVYLGIAGAIATGNSLSGMLFMTGFGLGTFPAMLSITMVRDHISIGFRDKIRKTVPVFVGIMALMLILRGMNLGIPYVSPSVEVVSGKTQMQCCKK